MVGKEKRKEIERLLRLKEEKPGGKEVLSRLLGETPEVSKLEERKAGPLLSPEVKGKVEKVLDRYGTAEILKLEGESLPLYRLRIPELTQKERELLALCKKKAVEEIKIDPDSITDPSERRRIFMQELMKILERESKGMRLPSGRLKELSELAFHDMIGYGPLDYLIADDKLEDILVIGVNKPVYVYHSRYGMCSTNIVFEDEDTIRYYIDKMARLVGRRIDHQMPLLDARLPDGSRINATIPPVSLEGPTLSIRKFRKDPLTVVDLMNFGTLSPEVGAFLWLLVHGLDVKPANILFSGGTGSGKTTLLNAATTFVPAHERIISIEDSVSGEAEVLAKVEGRVIRTTLGELVERALRERGWRAVSGHEVGEAPWEVLTLDGEGKVRFERPSLFIRHWVRKPLVRIRTATGREIRVTKDHSLFGVRGGELRPIRGGELRIGDYLAVPGRIRIEGEDPTFDLTSDSRFGRFKLAADGGMYVPHATSPQILPPRIKLCEELGILAGIWLADGFYDKNSVGFSVGQKGELAETVRRLASRLGLRVREHSDGHSLLINSAVFKTFFQEVLGLREDHERRVPEVFLGATEEVVAGLLRGYLSANGCVTRYEVQFSSASPALLRDLQALLLRFGIISRLRLEEGMVGSNGGRGVYRGSISGARFLRLLREKIGLIGEEKRRKLEQAASRRTGQETDPLPLAGRLREELREHTAGLAGKLGKNHWFLSRLRRALRRGRVGREEVLVLGELSPAFRRTSLYRLARSDLYFDRVVGVEEEEWEGYVYDLSLPETQSFVCNQILCHNTAELQLPHPHWVRLECVHPSTHFVDGEGVLREVGKTFELELKSQRGEILLSGANLYLRKPNLLRTLLATETARLRVFRDRVELLGRTHIPEYWVRVRTSDGSELRLTPGSPLIALSGGRKVRVRAEDLRPGDYLPVLRRIKARGRAVGIDPYSIFGPRWRVPSEEALPKLRRLVGKLKKRGLTNRELARMAGVSLKSLEGFLYKKGNPNHIPLGVLIRLSEGVGERPPRVRMLVGRRGKVPVRIPGKVDEGLSYLVGVISGDGSLEEYRIKIYPGRRMGRISTLFRESFGLLPVVRKRVRKGKTEWCYVVDSAVVSHFFRKVFGLPVGKKAKSVRVPEVIQRSGEGVIAAYLAGLVDTDGCVDWRNNRIFLSTSSRELAFGVRYLLLRLGVFSKLRRRKGGFKRSFGYQVVVSGGESESLASKLLPYLEDRNRKRARAMLGRDWQHRPRGVLGGEGDVLWCKVVEVRRERNWRATPSYNVAPASSHYYPAGETGLIATNPNTRPPNIEGRGEITMDDLVKNALRMRPDRIVVGEVRGPEARTMFTAMNTGHNGALFDTSVIQFPDGSHRLIGEVCEELFRKYAGRERKYGDLEFIELEEGDRFDVVSVDGRLKAGVHTVTRVWRRKVRKGEKMVRILTRSGQEVILTRNHPLFTIAGGEVVRKEAGSLKPGEFVACLLSPPVEEREPRVDLELFRGLSRYLLVPDGEGEVTFLGRRYRKVPNNGGEELWRAEFMLSPNSHPVRIPSSISTELAYLAGVVCGDGYLSSDGYFTSVTFDDEEYLEEFIRCARIYLPGYEFRGRREGKFCRLDLGSKIFSEVLAKVFGIPRGSKAASWTVPDLVLVRREILSSYLAGLFDADGSVDAGTPSIMLTTKSEEGARKVWYGLQRLGIPAVVRKYENGGKGALYRVMVRGVENLERFLRTIPMHHGRKRRELERVVREQRSYRGTYVERVPGVGESLRRLRESLGLSVAELSRRASRYWRVSESLIRHLEKGRSLAVGRRALGAMASAMLEEAKKRGDVGAVEVACKLGLLASSDVYWDEVERVEEVELEGKTVYDLTVEEDHNYVANGVLVSNCMGTLHANSAAETITRLTEPPMSVPPIMIPALDVIVMLQRIYHRQKGHIRRITEIAEITGLEGGKPQLSRIFKWNPRTDRVEPTGVPLKFRQVLSELSGRSGTEIELELKRRAMVLEWMRQKGIRNVFEVGKVIQEYYQDPEGLLKKVKGG
ncbi:MAG: ATPase, T2SS/T4P/T4SS family [Candidatus Hadarchaeales archaeon]